MSMVLTDLFEKTFCINLDRRLDRWLNVNSEFEKYNLTNVERFSAIDGKKIKNDTKLLDGEIGILLSHLEIIKKCKDKKIKNVLIIEDDVQFSNDIKNIEKYFKKVPTDWDMIYFGGNHTYGKTLESIDDNLYKLNNTVALHCVGINSTIYDDIINLLTKKEKQVDNYYTDIQKKYNCYGFYPNLATQKKDFSDIQNKIVDYSNFFK